MNFRLPLALIVLTVAAQAQDDPFVDGLLGKMTLEEKVGQLNQLSAGSVEGPVWGDRSGEDLIRAGLVGSVLNATTAYESDTYQKEAVEGSRLHIPLLFGLDVIHGFRTTFPIPLALSDTWDTQLIEATARFAAQEASAQGVRWTFSPMVDIARDARWGRITEGAGEDTYLGAAIARAYVRGYQGTKLSDPTSILACAKHFVGYGAPEGGREYNTTEISERTLRDVYLPPFKAAVDQGVATVMSAFNSLDGVPSSANPFTLSTILKGDWHFSGFVDSDWTAVRELMLHGLGNDETTVARKAFLAGVDMDMQSVVYLPHLPDLVKSGAVPQARLDDSVRRILRLKHELGLFERPYVVDPGSPFPPISAAGEALARRAAEESFVLLQNRSVSGARLLPLAPGKGKKIALIGPLADSAADMLGSWTCQGDVHDVVTLRRALAERADLEGMDLTYVEGTGISGGADGDFSDALAAVKGADIVIMAVGESARMTGEAAARAYLELPGNQEKLVEAVAGTSVPVILVVFSGRPLALPWEAVHVPAILQAWFPGVQAGPALVSTLFGDVNPSGRLTTSLPRTVGQEPIYYNALDTGRPSNDPIGLGIRTADAVYVTGYIDEANTPLYPFGYGLSYTSYSYSPVRVDQQEISAKALNDGSAHLTVSAEVKNTGAREGVETVQLYIRLRGTSVSRPVRELKGFRRLHLAPGEAKPVTFTLGKDELSFWNIDMQDVVEPSDLYLWIAPDCTRGIPARVRIRP